VLQKTVGAGTCGASVWFPNTPEAVQKMAKQLAGHGELDFCYESSGCGYGIYRQLAGLGHKCSVAAPSMIPRKPVERIKTDRRAVFQIIFPTGTIEEDPIRGFASRCRHLTNPARRGE
jgi:hypothetical protein